MQLHFDATQVDPTDRYEVLPAGDYEVMIVESEQKPTKLGDGSYLQLTLEVQSGPFQGRKIFDRLNLDNANRTAVEIAQRSLSQICHAINVLQVTNSEELHYKPMIAKVKVRPPRGEYDASNEVGGYKMAGSPAPAQRQAAPATAQRPATSAPWSTAQAAPPWAAQR